MQDNGLNIEDLSNKLSDELVRDLPMGAMTIMASLSEGSNIGATAAGGKNYEETSIAVNFAF